MKVPVVQVKILLPLPNSRSFRVALKVISERVPLRLHIATPLRSAIAVVAGVLLRRVPIGNLIDLASEKLRILQRCCERAPHSGKSLVHLTGLPYTPIGPPPPSDTADSERQLALPVRTRTSTRTVKTRWYRSLPLARQRAQRTFTSSHPPLAPAPFTSRNEISICRWEEFCDALRGKRAARLE